ncbi:DedA family protein [Naasia lichenicola]|uniref:DedA family protein n=1 Tax=Naasia lichenicola TaxID=2565933 RepID=A0A4S4FEZ9_9MICO|nr:DedA family protein [Naasia lichenicola]THG28749.1 DedA family protein [Naasia lichenicola]
MNEILDWLLQTVQSVDPILRTLLAGFAMFCETSILLGVIVPGDTTVIVASTAVNGMIEFWLLVLAVIVGSLSGESVGFALGRLVGPRLRDSRLGRRLGGGHWERAQRYLTRRGGPAVFISRFLPVFHSLIPLTVGMSSMRYSRFMRWTVPACIVWAVAYVTIGSVAAVSYRELASQLQYGAIVFVGIIAVGLVIVAVIRWLLHRAERRHMDDEAS